MRLGVEFLRIVLLFPCESCKDFLALIYFYDRILWMHNLEFWFHMDSIKNMTFIARFIVFTFLLTYYLNFATGCFRSMCPFKKNRGWRVDILRICKKKNNFTARAQWRFWKILVFLQKEHRIFNKIFFRVCAVFYVTKSNSFFGAIKNKF